MTCKDCIIWLQNLKNDLGEVQHSELWHYEQAIAEIIEMLKDDRIIELPKINEECYLFRVYYLDKQGRKHDHIVKTEEYLKFRLSDKNSLVYVAKGIFKNSYIPKINTLFFAHIEQAETKLKELNE